MNDLEPQRTFQIILRLTTGRGVNSRVMKYKQFEQLPVWQAALEIALKVFEFTDKADFRGFGDTKNQLERATVSISNNIAEGFERGANTELIYFLYISKGSAGECRSMLRLCEYAHAFQISNLKFQI